MTDRKAHALHHESTASERWHEAVEGCYCALTPLAEQLPEVNQLLDNSFTEISAIFVSLAGEVEAHHRQVREALEAPDSAAREALEASHKKMSGMLSEAIIKMQFQDRVSQNLVITANVIKAVMSHLQNALGGENVGAIPFDTEFAAQTLTLLNLAEIKRRYIRHLVERGHIQDASELGYDMREPAPANDDVDLF